MIETNTIYFRKSDVPDLPELKPMRKAAKSGTAPVASAPAGQPGDAEK